MQLRDLLVLGLQAEQHPRTLGLVLFLHRTDQRVRRCGGGGVRRFGGAIVGRSCCGGPLWWNRSCGPIGRKWCRGRPLSGRWTHVWHRTRLIARRGLLHFSLATSSCQFGANCNGALPADDCDTSTRRVAIPASRWSRVCAYYHGCAGGKTHPRTCTPFRRALYFRSARLRTRVVPHAQH